MFSDLRYYGFVVVDIRKVDPVKKTVAGKYLVHLPSEKGLTEEIDREKG
jgi:hypothetical protein